MNCSARRRKIRGMVPMIAGFAVLTAGAVAAIVILAGERNAAADSGAFERAVGIPVAGESGTVREYAIGGKSRLRFEGMWKAEIRRGDEARLLVHAPEEIRDGIRVSVSEDTVRLVRDDRSPSVGRSVRAEIILPDLTGIDSAGSADLSFSGFEGGSLDITSSGAANVRGEGRGYRMVRIDSSGALNADLHGVPAESAHVTISGSAHVVLCMQGGRLTGTVGGAAKILYSGDVSEELIETSGLAGVERR